MQNRNFILRDKLATVNLLRYLGPRPKNQTISSTLKFTAHASKARGLHLNSISVSKKAQSSLRLLYNGSRLQDTARGARPFSTLGITSTTSLVSKNRTRSPNLRQSSASPWLIAIAVGLLGGALLYNVHPLISLPDNQEKPSDSEQIEIQNFIAGNRHNMTGEVLSGRPGTLTVEEEIKLKELWIATLDVFGVLDKDAVTNGEAEPTPGVARVDSKKPKKKRFGILRSKDKTEDGKHEAKKETEEEDKYNHNKIFKDTLATLTPETLRATFWSMVKHDHPDALLLRFLRARKWDVEKALVMMISTMRWRSHDFKVDDDIMKNGEFGAFEEEKSSDEAKAKFGADFLAPLRLGKSFLHGTDKEGRPMCFVRVRLHKQGEQSEESLERYTVFFIETCRMVLSPTVDTACVVFDMTGFSLANMDYSPVKFMIQCFEANYPESLGVVLIHKAPWVFQGIWKIIKGWLDPVVASKIRFTNDNKAIEEYVPAPQVIKELEGAEDWTYNYIEPVPGENDRMKDTATRDKLLEARKGIVKEYEATILDWINGNVDVDAAKVKRNEIANKLREDYWNLDPYLRARSYYDRVGLIQPGGKLQFYPEKNTESAASAAPVAAAPAPAPATSADDLD